MCVRVSVCVLCAGCVLEREESWVWCVLCVCCVYGVYECGCWVCVLMVFCVHGVLCLLEREDMSVDGSPYERENDERDEWCLNEGNYVSQNLSGLNGLQLVHKFTFWDLLVNLPKK